MEASAAQCKQLKLLLQCKVTACIAREEDAQRVLKAGREASHSRISRYRKGKAPEKCVCMNCLRKGIECKWDEGGQGESYFILFLTCTDCKGRKILPAMLEQ